MNNQFDTFTQMFAADPHSTMLAQEASRLARVMERMDKRICQLSEQVNPPTLRIRRVLLIRRAARRRLEKCHQLLDARGAELRLMLARAPKEST